MAKLGRRELSLLLVAVIALAALGWVLGGPQPMRTITHDIPVPESAR